jgi:hypothetical protein
MSRTRAAVGRSDLIALSVIIAAYALALLLMPIQHDFAIFDDWTYVRTAEKAFGNEGFRPSEYAQATIVTHSYWGALFANLFGMSFATLTAAVMTLSLVAALAFYVLLRRLDFPPVLGILGVAMLILNPYVISLSYSFMTEITFVSMLLLSCLFYYEGLRGNGDGWLWLGGIFAALTFLTRQFGLAVALAALLWLLYSRQLTWGKAVAVALPSLLAVVGYYAWSSGFGTTFSGSVGREEIAGLLHNPASWIRRASHFVYLALPLPGLLVPLFGRVRHWKTAGILMVGAALAVFVLWQVKYDLVSQGESTVNELSYYWLDPVIRDRALITLIYCAGGALTVWLMAGIVERAWPGFVALVRRRREPLPADFLWLVAIILFTGTYIVSAGFLDRYWLPLLPFLIAAALGGLKFKSIFNLAPAMAVLAALATFGIMAHLDDYNKVNTLWQAGRWLVSQGVPYDKIKDSYSWDGYFLHDEPARRFGSLDIKVIGRVYPPHLVIDPEYIVDFAPQPGYRVLRTYTYFSPLNRMTNVQVYVLHRQ